MTVLQNNRVQCDTCLTVHVLCAKSSDDWGAGLFDDGWIARLLGGRYRHACRLCANQLPANQARLWVSPC